MLVIDPDECIDCALCEPECPADAIYSEDELPIAQTEFLTLNSQLSNSWPNITEIGLPPPDADEWLKKSGKRELLEIEWPSK